MKGILVQTTLYGESDLNKVLKSQRIGRDSKVIGSQFPIFKDRPLTFCSYFCKGYEETYGDREGIMFRTEAHEVYACPVDSFELMRGGNWLPGYERFIFSSIEEMLQRYPTSNDFKKVFQEYFSRLNPKDVYPDNELDFAQCHHEGDYCLKSDWALGCNEVTFNKPLKIEVIGLFKSKLDLQKMINE